VGQDVTLHPTGTNVLFAMGGPISFVATRPLRMRFAVEDGAIQTAEPLVEPLEYQVVSSNDLGPPPARDLKELARQIDQPRDLVTEWADDASWKFGTGPFDPGVVERIKQWAYERKAARFGSGWAIDPKIGEFARRLEVSGSDAGRGMAARRGPDGIAGNLDATIASNIERYLRTHFKYTLDLTDARRIEDRDPIVSFLYDWQRGHCEYFAGAMTLMCQSLGMEARMVVGFRVPPDEYNGLGKYYIVRQSAAHAWVEVRTASGWQSYDPTSDTDADRAGRTASSWRKVLHVLDYLELRMPTR